MIWISLLQYTTGYYNVILTSVYENDLTESTTAIMR